MSSVQAQHNIFAVDPASVEHQDVELTELYAAIAVTSVSHANNYLNKLTHPICINAVKRVREAVMNGTRDMYIEVNGCAVKEPRGACDMAVERQNVPYELNIMGAEETPGFDPLAALRLAQPVESPYKVRSIAVLL